MEHDGSALDIRVIGGARRAAVEVRAEHVRRGGHHYLLGWIVSGSTPRCGEIDFRIEPAVWRWEEDGEQVWMPASRAKVTPRYRPLSGVYDAKSGEIDPVDGDEGALATYDIIALREHLDVVAATLAQWRRTAGIRRVNPNRRERIASGRRRNPGTKTYHEFYRRDAAVKLHELDWLDGLEDGAELWRLTWYVGSDWGNFELGKAQVVNGEYIGRRYPKSFRFDVRDIHIPVEGDLLLNDDQLREMGIRGYEMLLAMVDRIRLLRKNKRA